MRPAQALTCVDVPAPIVDAGGAVAGAVGNQFAEAMADGAGWVLRTTVGWWIDVPAVDLMTWPADTVRGYVLWLSVAIVTLAVMWQGIQLMVRRRADPLINVGRGLFVFALFGAVGIIAPSTALRASDAFSTWVLNESTSGAVADRLSVLATFTGVPSSGAVIVLGLLMMLSGLAQAMVMIFREGAVVVRAGVVVLAAAGSVTPATRPWLQRVVGWIVALIAYKPAAALVYATAFTMAGDGSDPRTVVVGLTMIVLAIVALPAMMKFFTWTTGAAASSSGAGMAALAAGTSVVQSAVSMAGRSGAATQASHIQQDLGTPDVGPAPKGPTGSGAPPVAAGLPPNTASSGGAAATTTTAAGSGGTAAAAGGAVGGSAGGLAAAAGPAGIAVAAVGLGATAASHVARQAQDHLSEEGSSRGDRR